MKLLYKVLGGILAVLVLAVATLAVVLGHTSDCKPAPELSGVSQSMKAIVYRCYGSAEVLSYEDVEKPQPADDELLIKVEAAGINPLDWHYMRGAPYLMRLVSGLGAPDDIRMGVDFSGVVESVGSDVTLFKVGDEVFGGTGGALAEYAVIREDRGVALKPANTSFVQAAAVPIAAITALQALRDKGQLKPGMNVLINGASGGVGTYAVQIAKALGARVSGVCSTRNVEMVLSLGADAVFDYKQQDYTQSEERFDLIIDNIGNHSQLENSKVMKPGGILVMVGDGPGDWVGPLAGPVEALVYSPFVNQKFELLLAVLNGEDMRYLAELMRTGKVVSQIDRQYPLHDAKSAIAYVEEGHARGKVVVTME
jgi:NADPH:quinone reductase-like Zn-dependent oxidoreductase